MGRKISKSLRRLFGYRTPACEVESAEVRLLEMQQLRHKAETLAEEAEGTGRLAKIRRESNGFTEMYKDLGLGE